MPLQGAGKILDVHDVHGCLVRRDDGVAEIRVAIIEGLDESLYHGNPEAPIPWGRYWVGRDVPRSWRSGERGLVA